MGWKDVHGDPSTQSFSPCQVKLALVMYQRIFCFFHRILNFLLYIGGWFSFFECFNPRFKFDKDIIHLNFIITNKVIQNKINENIIYIELQKSGIIFSVRSQKTNILIDFVIQYLLYCKSYLKIIFKNFFLSYFIRMQKKSCLCNIFSV